MGEVTPRCRLQGSAACNITPECTHVQYVAQTPKWMMPCAYTRRVRRACAPQPPYHLYQHHIIARTGRMTDSGCERGTGEGGLRRAWRVSANVPGERHKNCYSLKRQHEGTKAQVHTGDTPRTSADASTDNVLHPTPKLSMSRSRG
jgi:hypothetical protein